VARSCRVRRGGAEGGTGDGAARDKVVQGGTGDGAARGKAMLYTDARSVAALEKGDAGTSVIKKILFYALL
jgi:hypothetical protein